MHFPSGSRSVAALVVGLAAALSTPLAQAQCMSGGQSQSRTNQPGMMQTPGSSMMLNRGMPPGQSTARLQFNVQLAKLQQQQQTGLTRQQQQLVTLTSLQQQQQTTGLTPLQQRQLTLFVQQQSVYVAGVQQQYAYLTALQQQVNPMYQQQIAVLLQQQGALLTALQQQYANAAQLLAVQTTTSSR